jgi:glyoxylase-like metal-dependent hydrolase (beta-lactamase superfamily II)
MTSAAKQTIKLPKGMQVFERGWLSSNNILCLADDSAVLVDSGYLTHANQTLALVQHVLNGRPLTTLINTHLHSDHCGGNALLQRTYGCRTLIPIADAAAVTAWDEQALTFEATAQKCERFTFDACIKPGDSLSMAGLDWQVMAAPGHDPHSMMLYCASEAILISADALWEHGFGVIFPELVGESGFAEQASVLKLISELDVRLVIPGHGAPFTDVRGALDRANSRLAFLSEDNGKHGRNARNALKALIAFLLLDAQKFSMSEVAKHIQNSRIMRAAAQQIGTPIALLVEQLVAELVTAGVAKMHGDLLVSSR